MQKSIVLFEDSYKEINLGLVSILWGSCTVALLLVNLAYHFVNGRGLLTLVSMILLLGGLLTIIFYNVIIAFQDKMVMVKRGAEKANKVKCDFFANMSHELRTPLNAVLGFTQLLLKDSSITEKQFKNLKTIQRNSEHLLSLISNILEFSKIEAGNNKLNEENFDLHQLLFNIREMFLLRARKKGLSLIMNQSTDLPRFIKADQNKLNHILINIIGNAVKFTEAGGIKVNLKRGEVEKKYDDNKFLLHVEIEDTGVGIYPCEQERIFDPFFQNGDSESLQQGSGLGLSICKKFIELMGGTIKLLSKPSKGSTFILEIPIEIASNHGAKLTNPAQQVVKLKEGQREFKLLVAEDNDINRELLVSQLKSVGFKVKEASNGADAVRLWQQWQPDLIWMDMRMPVLDGYSATKIIKSEIEKEKADDTIIVALTASAFEDERENILACGCSEFIRKPAKEADFFLLLTKYLDVKFEYEENEKRCTFSKELTEEIKADIHTLPVNILNSLKEATELSDSERIVKVIKMININNPEVAYAMQNFADNYAYDDILNLLGEIKILGKNLGKAN